MYHYISYIYHRNYLYANIHHIKWCIKHEVTASNSYTKRYIGKWAFTNLICVIVNKRYFLSFFVCLFWFSVILREGEISLRIKDIASNPLVRPYVSLVAFLLLKISHMPFVIDLTTWCCWYVREIWNKVSRVISTTKIEQCLYYINKQDLSFFIKLLMNI